MTAQYSDTISYKGKQFSLTNCSSGSPFDPISYGYNPVMESTGCYLGYINGYKVENNLLFLDELQINHEENGLSVSEQKQSPILNGVEGIKLDYGFDGWIYDAIELPLKYTGKLTIADGFISELYIHNGYHPAWKFEEVYELIFESGMLVSESDLSEQMLEIRLKNIKEMKFYRL